MNKLLLVALYVFTTVAAQAQQEYSVFTSTGRGVATTFETDYHTVGINPANLGFKRKYETKHVTFGLAEIAFSAYTGALEKKEFRQTLTDFADGHFTNEQKMKAASQFAGEKLALNGDINWFGISFQNDKIGGFAFNVRETQRWYSTFNKNFADVMFLGYKASYFDSLRLNNGTMVANDPSNYATADAIGISEGIRKAGTGQMYSQLFGGTQLSMLLYREYNLSYGKEFELNDNFAIAGGIGVKYLQGYGMMNVDFKNNSMVASSAFSPAFNIDYGKAALSNPSSDSSGRYRPVGNGLGLDLGFNVYIKEKIKLGVALTNIGSIHWDGNVYTIQDTALYNMKTSGFNSYNIFSEASKMTSDKGFFKWQGKEKIVTNLPTTLRIGGSHQFEDKGEVGVDLVIPMNHQPGSLNKPYWAVGGDFKVIRFLRLSAGVSHGGNYSSRVNIPLGVTFIVGENGTWEFGLSSRDAVTYFRSQGPALSFAFGFLRFRL